MSKPITAAILATSMSVVSPVVAQDFDFDSDVKLISSTETATPLPDYLVFATEVPLTGKDLLDYYRAAAPEASFADFLKANPGLQAVSLSSRLREGTIFVVPRPAESRHEE